MQMDYFEDLSRNVELALSEDIGESDISAQLIDIETSSSAEVICREPAIICGQPWVNEVFEQVDRSLVVEWLVKEGDAVKADQSIFRVKGKARSLLTAERAALNYLQLLSGTASTTQHFVQLIAHTKARLLDTRKTIPGLRRAQKYAVNLGGGKNHRMGLYDAFLIKENHIIACGSITKAIERAKALYPEKRIEVEVESLEEFYGAVAAKPHWIMLDNFSLRDMRAAVLSQHEDIFLEASGGIEKNEDLIAIAETGVDYISMGILTKDVNSIDLSMRIREQ